jgi:uncharacterized membrane protein YraQ (UPF0718 family)
MVFGKFRFFGAKAAPACDVHGAPHKSTSRVLIGMLLATLSLIVWRVWVYGPSAHLAASEAVSKSFLQLLAGELWDLLFDKHGIVAELRDVFPYFIVGVLLAGYLRTYKVAVKLQATLRKYGVMSVIIASFVGIITPLCACGTLTTAISLLFAGLPLAPVMSLLVTSPLLSPSTYLLTLNDLGPEWTVIRTISALSMGIIAGLLTHFMRKRGFETKNLFIEGAIVRGDFHDEDYPDEKLRCNCKQKFGNRVAVRTSNKFLIFLAKSSEMIWLVGKYILVGVIIGSVIERYMPSEWIYQFFGRKDSLNVVWVTLGSVPMFLHQISASSILSHIKSALPGTMDSSAALAFMVGGPVTAMPTMVLFWTVFKKRVFALYMTVCLGGTLLIAFAFQLFVFVPGVDTGNALLRGVRSLSGGASAVIQKQSPHVRIVLDPAGNNSVATYINDLDNRGGIVFDGGAERFLATSASRFGNQRYIVNVAKWLEDNSSSDVKEKILVYTIADNTAVQTAYLNPAVVQALQQKGFTVVAMDRQTAPVLTDKLLAGYNQLWLCTAGQNARFNPGEVAAVTRFNEAGKGMLIVAGDSPAPGSGAPGVNDLTTSYGVRFAGQVVQGAELPVARMSTSFDVVAEWLGKMLKLVHKA